MTFDAALLTGAAALVRAVALYVAIPVGVVGCLYRPRSWLEATLKNWKKGRAKFGLMEAEFERDTTVALGDAVPLLAPTAAEAPPTEPDETTGVVDGAVNSEDWFVLMSGGRYDEGVEAAKRDATPKTTIAEQVAHLAFARLIAFIRGGTTRALDDLRLMVAENPTFVDTRLWYARALHFGSRFDDAIREARTALSGAATDAERGGAAQTLAMFLTEAKRFGEAVTILIDAIVTTTQSKERALLFTSLAATYEKSGNTHRAFVFYEAGLREEPNERSQRFDVAYKYGLAGAPSLALWHYRKLLISEPDNETFLNNAGWASDSLRMKIRAAELYAHAAKEGSTLAMSNLASFYLNAGLVDEARNQLKHAQESDNVDNRVLTTLGELGRQTAAEQVSADEFSDAATALTKRRLMEADALTQVAPTVATVAGAYTGVPIAATLLIDAGGSVSGSFQPGYASAKEAWVTGVVDGAVIRFKWTTANPGEAHTILGQLMTANGEGVLFYQDGKWVGYSVDGVLGFDAVKAKGQRDWSMEKSQSAVPLLQSLPFSPRMLSAPAQE